MSAQVVTIVYVQMGRTVNEHKVCPVPIDDP